MKQRPLSITIIGCLFLVTCSVGLMYHLLPQHIGELSGPGSSAHELPWAIAIRLLGVIAGAFILLGHNWARWLLALWVGYHVGLSAFHSLFEVAVHGLLFLLVLFFLFRPKSSEYFRAKCARAGQGTTPDEPKPI